MMTVRTPADVWGRVFLAVDWYEARTPGVGLDLLQKIEDTLDGVARNPLQFPVIRGGIRRARTKRFPYAVFFEICDGMILVSAIVDLRRSPKEWKLPKRG